MSVWVLLHFRHYELLFIILPICVPLHYVQYSSSSSNIIFICDILVQWNVTSDALTVLTLHGISETLLTLLVGWELYCSESIFSVFELEQKQRDTNTYRTNLVCFADWDCSYFCCSVCCGHPQRFLLKPWIARQQEEDSGYWSTQRAIILGTGPTRSPSRHSVGAVVSVANPVCIWHCYNDDIGCYGRRRLRDNWKLAVHPRSASPVGSFRHTTGDADEIFVPSEMPVSAPEFQASALDAISVMIASASDAVGVGSWIQHDGDDVQLFKPLVGVDENLDDPATIEEYETLDTLQICATPSGSIEEEPIGNFQPALPLLSPLASSPDRHRHPIHPTVERRGDSTSASARRRDVYDERKRHSPLRYDSVRRCEHPTDFRMYQSHHGRQIRLSLREYRELQDRRRRTSADVQEGTLARFPSSFCCFGLEVLHHRGRYLSEPANDVENISTWMADRSASSSSTESNLNVTSSIFIIIIINK